MNQHGHRVYCYIILLEMIENQQYSNIHSKHNNSNVGKKSRGEKPSRQGRGQHI